MLPEGRLACYTDGSKIQGKVGAAVSVLNESGEAFYTSFRLESFCTVFQAEIVAIRKATELALKRRRSVNIISDSRAALQAVCNPTSQNPVAAETRVNLEEAEAAEIEIDLFWIKAHSEFPGNERSDELAKAAALKNKRAPAYDMFPLSYARRTIRAATIDKWQNRFAQAETAGGTKVFFEDVRRNSRESAH